MDSHGQPPLVRAGAVNLTERVFLGEHTVSACRSRLRIGVAIDVSIAASGAGAGDAVGATARARDLAADLIVRARRFCEVAARTRGVFDEAREALVAAARAADEAFEARQRDPSLEDRAAVVEGERAHSTLGSVCEDRQVVERVGERWCGVHRARCVGRVDGVRVHRVGGFDGGDVAR